VKPGSQIVLVNAVRLFAPLILLFALSLLSGRAPGGGVGVLAGMAFALALVLYALVFGVAALRAAFPPPMVRLALALGLLAALAGASLPRWIFAAQAIEGGAALTTAAAASFTIVALFGRAPTLRDAEW